MTTDYSLHPDFIDAIKTYEFENSGLPEYQALREALVHPETITEAHIREQMQRVVNAIAKLKLANDITLGFHGEAIRRERFGLTTQGDTARQAKQACTELGEEFAKAYDLLIPLKLDPAAGLMVEQMAQAGRQWRAQAAATAINTGLIQPRCNKRTPLLLCGN